MFFDRHTKNPKKILSFPQYPEPWEMVYCATRSGPCSRMHRSPNLLSFSLQDSFDKNFFSNVRKNPGRSSSAAICSFSATRTFRKLFGRMRKSPLRLRPVLRPYSSEHHRRRDGCIVYANSRAWLCIASRHCKKKKKTRCRHPALLEGSVDLHKKHHHESVCHREAKYHCIR